MDGKEGLKQWKENLTIFQNRKAQEQRFKASRNQRIKTLQSSLREKESTKVRDEISEFEERHLRKAPLMESREDDDNDPILLTLKAQKLKLVANICNAIDIKLIREGIKLREKETHSEITRKEKDRRLRKMIVDFKKWQAVRDVHSLKDKTMHDVLRERNKKKKSGTNFLRPKATKKSFWKTEN